MATPKKKTATKPAAKTTAAKPAATTEKVTTVKAPDPDVDQHGDAFAEVADEAAAEE